jgi:hypothetical protein
MTARAAAMLTAGFYAAAVTALGLPIVSAPLPILLDRFVPDDAFYYFNTARVFAVTGFSSFDEVHFTNGYQPLWFLMSVPVFRVFPDGGEVPFRLMLLLQLGLGAAGAAVMARTIAVRFGAPVALVSGLFWLLICQRTLVNGLETGLQTLLFAVSLAAFLRYVEAPPGDSARRAGRLGLAAALLALARTDGLFLVGALAAFVVGRRPRRTRDFVAFAIPVAVLVGGYLAINLAVTGHAMPVSGAAKMYHSEAARAAASAAGTSPTRAWLGNLLWPFAGGAWWAATALTLSIAACVAAWRWWLATVEQTWPFAAAVVATFVFYGVAFYGGFTRTLWYYGPLMLMAWFHLAAGARAAAAALGRARGDGRLRWPALPLLADIPWLLPYLILGAGLGWLGPWALLAGIAAALVGRWAAAPLGPAAVAAALTVAASLAAWRFARGGLLVEVWTVVTLIGVGLGSAAAALRSARLTFACVALGIALPTLLTHATNVLADRRAPAVGWNAHLLAGAEWARRTLPEEATIWSASAGILGYFSGRRVVNTDGLANDYEFLDTVLRPQRYGPYIRQWDYAIDAFDDRSLEQIVPEGCFVPLPDEVAPPPFVDAGVRQLAVYQMTPTGIVRCPVRR